MPNFQKIQTVSPMLSKAPIALTILAAEGSTAPHFGHLSAVLETSAPQSGHLRSFVLFIDIPPIVYFALFFRLQSLQSIWQFVATV